MPPAPSRVRHLSQLPSCCRIVDYGGDHCAVDVALEVAVLTSGGSCGGAAKAGASTIRRRPSSEVQKAIIVRGDLRAAWVASAAAPRAAPGLP